MAPVVILGAGLAGFGVARELRKLDKTVSIRMVTADAGAFYSKPSLSNALAAGKAPAQLVVSPRAAIAAQLGIDIAAGVSATALQPPQHLLETSSGSIEYAKLVLAVGAQSIRLLVDAQEATARTARSLFPVVDKANDQPTADLLTQRLEVHEKTAWMLRSLLED